MFPRPWPQPSLLNRLLPAAWIVMVTALLLVSAVIVVIGLATDASMPGAPDQELLAPFRWTPLSGRGLA